MKRKRGRMERKENRIVEGMMLIDIYASYCVVKIGPGISDSVNKSCLMKI